MDDETKEWSPMTVEQKERYMETMMAWERQRRGLLAADEVEEIGDGDGDEAMINALAAFAQVDMEAALASMDAMVVADADRFDVDAAVAAIRERERVRLGRAMEVLERPEVAGLGDEERARMLREAGVFEGKEEDYILAATVQAVRELRRRRDRN
jgi:hypothetical protein